MQQDIKMTYEQLLMHYGSIQKSSRALNIKRQLIQNWRKRGYIPYDAQLMIQHITEQALIADTEEEIFTLRKEINLSRKGAACTTRSSATNRYWKK